jgi:predicted MFS family arabinose efflux permease
MAEELKTTAERNRGLSEMFRALRHRNFLLFWSGAFLSNAGTWMQAVAQGWLVLSLSNAFWLGVDGFMATAPGLVFTLVGGVFADAIDRRKLLIYSQIVAGMSALTLGVLVVTAVVKVWMILVLSFVTGCCMSIAGPSYLALVFDLVGREDLANAIALNSTQFQLARAIGPLAAGIGFKLFGVAGCFFANGLSFAAVVAALAMVRYDKTLNPQANATAKMRGRFRRDLADGFRYVAQHPTLAMLLLISAVTSMFGTPYISMSPVFARDVLHMGETGLALLMGMAGAGALVGALFLAYLGDFRHKGWFVLGGYFAFAVCLIGFSLATKVAISLIFLFALGFAVVGSVAVTNTLLQKLVTDEMRGRVMSMFMLSFIGAMPIGNLIAGWASHRFGAPHTLAVGGLIIAVFVTTVASRSPRLRAL